MKLFVPMMTLISTLFAFQASFSQDGPTENSFFETKEEKELFQIEIQRFILENPAIIIEAIQLYQKNKETGKSISSALNKIKPQYKEILVMRLNKHMTYKDISNKLNLPRGTVMSRIHLAKKNIRKH